MIFRLLLFLLVFLVFAVLPFQLLRLFLAAAVFVFKSAAARAGLVEHEIGIKLFGVLHLFRFDAPEFCE